MTRAASSRCGLTGIFSSGNGGATGELWIEILGNSVIPTAMGERCRVQSRTLRTPLWEVLVHQHHETVIVMPRD
jgi:hypothetical protein